MATASRYSLSLFPDEAESVQRTGEDELGMTGDSFNFSQTIRFIITDRQRLRRENAELREEVTRLRQHALEPVA